MQRLIDGFHALALTSISSKWTANPLTPSFIPVKQPGHPRLARPVTLETSEHRLPLQPHERTGPAPCLNRSTSSRRASSTSASKTAITSHSLLRPRAHSHTRLSAHVKRTHRPQAVSARSTRDLPVTQVPRARASSPASGVTRRAFASPASAYCRVRLSSGEACAGPEPILYCRTRRTGGYLSEDG